MGVGKNESRDSWSGGDWHRRVFYTFASSGQIKKRLSLKRGNMILKAEEPKVQGFFIVRMRANVILESQIKFTL